MSARAWIRVPRREEKRNNIHAAPEKRDLNFEFHQMEGAKTLIQTGGLSAERKEIRSGEKGKVEFAPDAINKAAN